MPTTLLTLAEELAPYVVAIISVFGVVFTAYHERASQLKAAYFQKMSDAYEQYFDALVRYVYNDPPTGGTSLVVATHTAALYASAEISHHLQLLTKMALSYRQSGTPDIHLSLIHISLSSTASRMTLGRRWRSSRTMTARFSGSPQATST